MASHLKAGWLDVSAKAGVLLGAHASGTSYQPNLLSRASRDQALIAGVSAATAYGFALAQSHELPLNSSTLTGD